MSERALPTLVVEEVSATRTPARLLVGNRDPAPGASGVPRRSTISLEVLDLREQPVGSATLRVTVGGVEAYDDSRVPAVAPGFDGLRARVELGTDTLRITLDPLQPFASQASVEVRAFAGTDADAVEESWIAVAFANPETTTGGNALKFYASMRLDVRRIGQVKAEENNIGNRTRVKIVKNKMAPPFGSCEFDIRFGVGMNALGDLLDIAVDSGVVSKNGAYYTFADESLGQGRERARTLLSERADLRAKIEAAQPKVVTRGGVESEVAAA